MRHLTLDPYIPLALWVPLALAAAGLLVWYAVDARGRLSGRRRWGVIALMALAVTVPLVVLLNPTWLERIPPPAGKPLLTVCLDRSASMSTADAQGGLGRRELADRLARQIQARLADRYEVRIQPFAADTPVTDLAAVIEDSLEEDRPQGQAVMLLSDGVHNAPGGSTRLRESLAKAKAMAAPVYVTTVGGPTGTKDLEVGLNLPQELALVGQQVPVVVTLRQRGSLAGRTSLKLVCEDKVVQQRDAKLIADGVSEEVFQLTGEQAGLYRYEIRADGLPGEVTEVNNTATLLLRVVDQPVRVLLLEGKPYWDTKFLIRTLSRDRSTELVSVVQMAPGRLLKRTITRPDAGAPSGGSAPKPPPAPKPELGNQDGDESQAGAMAVRSESWSIEKDAGKILSAPEALAPYQIVVLGRDADVYLTDEALAELKKWLVSGEGSLVCFRGPPSSKISQRLGELMPVGWSPMGESRFRVQWTTEGQALRWLPSGGDDDLLAGLPSLAAVNRVQPPKALAVVLATTAAEQPQQRTPVITYQPVGSGRVVVVEGAGMWRWAFLAPEYRQHDDVYAMLWRGLVRWLVSNVGLLPSQQLALRTDKVTFTTTEAVTATLLVRQGQLGPEVPQIELTGGDLTGPRLIAPVPGGSVPGQFRVALGRLPEGRYQARAVGPVTDEVSAVAAFVVRGNLKERLDVRARPNVMKMIADRSGGMVLQDADPDGLGQQIEQHLGRSLPERTVQTTAWDRWWMLLGALTIWGAAWGLRRWSGLV